MVERRGEFAVRGGLLDIFPPTEDHPLRIEFWGEMVEEIRWFAVADQRSLEVSTHGLWAPPCREILLSDEVRARARALIPVLPGATDMLDKLAAGVAVEGMESLAPALVEKMQPLLELVPPQTLLLVAEPERVRRRAHDLVATTAEFLAAAWTGAAAGGSTPIDLSAASFATLADTRALSLRLGLGWWSLSPFGLDTARPDGTAAGAVVVDPVATDASDDAGPSLVVAAREVDGYRGELTRALEDLRALQRDGWRLVLTTEGHGPAQRMVEQLGAADVAARLESRLEAPPEPGVVVVVPGPGWAGFVAAALKLAVFSETDLTGGPGRAHGTCGGCRPGGATSSTRSSFAPATSWCTSSMGSAGSPISSSARSAPAPERPPASTSSSSTRRPRRANRATGCTSRPISSTRSPSTPVASRRPCTGSAGRTGRRRRAARARRCVRSLPS